MNSVPLSYNTSLQPSQLLRARFGNGRISFPVRPSQAIYAHFKYVSGVPAGGEDQGLTLSRLKSIDNLIDRLVQLKKSVGSGPEKARIQQMIDTLREEMEHTGNSVGDTVSTHAESLHSLAEPQGLGYSTRPAMGAALFSMSA
jgi:hypothetical protein